MTHVISDFLVVYILFFSKDRDASLTDKYMMPKNTVFNKNPRIAEPVIKCAPASIM